MARGADFLVDLETAAETVQGVSVEPGRTNGIEINSRLVIVGLEELLVYPGVVGGVKAAKNN